MKAVWMRNRVNIAKKISRREDSANATNIAYGSETVEARFAESLKSWRNRKTKRDILSLGKEEE